MLLSRNVGTALNLLNWKQNIVEFGVSLSIINLGRISRRFALTTPLLSFPFLRWSFVFQDWINLILLSFWGLGQTNGRTFFRKEKRRGCWRRLRGRREWILVLPRNLSLKIFLNDKNRLWGQGLILWIWQFKQYLDLLSMVLWDCCFSFGCWYWYRHFLFSFWFWGRFGAPYYFPTLSFYFIFLIKK